MVSIVPLTSDNLKKVDFAATDGPFALTVELKSSGADYWVSSLTEQNGLVVVARLAMPVEGSDEREMMRNIEVVYAKWVAPVAAEGRRMGGLVSVPAAPEPPDKRVLCEAHLDLHGLMGNIDKEGLDPKVNMARQFQLIKSIGFKSAVPMISKRSGLKQTTVVRRLDTAKAMGLLPKLERPEHLRD